MGTGPFSAGGLAGIPKCPGAVGLSTLVTVRGREAGREAREATDLMGSPHRSGPVTAVSVMHGSANYNQAGCRVANAGHSERQGGRQGGH